MDIPNIPIEARVLPEDDPGQLDVEKKLTWERYNFNVNKIRFQQKNPNSC